MSSCTYEAENGLCYKSVRGGYEITAFTGSEKILQIPKEINNKPVVGIAEGAFSGIDVRSISIPDSVTYIGEKAFYKCKFLSNITLGSGLLSLGEQAFDGCEIEVMDFAGSMEDWFHLESYNWKTMYRDYFRFQGVPASRELVIPSFVTEIPHYAFQGAPITSLVLHDGVTQIGAFAFHTCKSLTQIRFGAGLKEIGQWGFGHCGLSGSIVLPRSLETIRSYAFGDHQPNLQSVYIPESVTVVERAAFCDPDVILYCEATSEPFAWDPMWAFFKENVVWGAAKAP